MNKYINSIPFNMIRLCIDSYNGYKITGKAYNSTISECIDFMDIYEVILRMDRVFDHNGNPLSSQIRRSFHQEDTVYPYQNKPSTLVSYEELAKHKGKIAAFDIVVKGRRNSTWQGCVFHRDIEYTFSTILDMIKILDSLLKKC